MQSGRRWLEVAVFCKAEARQPRGLTQPIRVGAGVYVHQSILVCMRIDDGAAGKALAQRTKGVGPCNL